MKTPKRVLGLGLILTAAALCSCQSSPHKDDRYVFVTTNVSVPYWQDAQAGFRDSVKVLVAKAEFAGPTGYDPNAEVKAFNDAAATHPSGILVSPAQPAMFNGPINNAIGQGIPVICVDSDAPDSKRLMFIGTDNYEAGRNSGNLAAKVLRERGRIAVLTINGQYNLDQRLNGLRDALKAYPYMGVELAVDDQGDEQTATSVITDTLARKQHHIDGIVALDAGGGPGAAKAVQQARMSGALPIVAMDADPATLKFISDSVISATIVQKPYAMAFYGVRFLDDLHHNSVRLFTDWRTAPASPLPSYVDTGTAVVNGSNVDEYGSALAASATKH
jgi:ribose transport system substrate-binding protein